MSQSDKNPDLSGAIRQLEALLDAQTDGDEQGEPQLPLLDEIVDDDSVDSLDDAFDLNASSSTPAQPDPEQLRAVVERLAEQMDTELENIGVMLKQNMLEEFRKELAAALNMDPQQLRAATSEQKNKQS